MSKYTLKVDESNNTFNDRIGKRLLADRNSCLLELKNEATVLFSKFEEALSVCKSKLSEYPPSCRARTLEANILQSCFTKVVVEAFEGNAFLGKYKRLIIHAKGYLVLFKKLDKKGYPMNIKTSNVQSILNQDQASDLFSDAKSNDEPILYFGYQKDKIGQYSDPQLVYIDEGKIKFVISSEDVQLSLPFSSSDSKLDQIEEIHPKLKANDLNKKAK